MPSRKNKEYRFLAMWDMLGLECLIDLNAFENSTKEYEKKKIWATLKEENFKDFPPSIPLQMMIMRARANSQRHYEIYTFSTTDMNEKEVRLRFEDSPQLMVDLIREKGFKIFSDRVDTKRQVIV